MQLKGGAGPSEGRRGERSMKGSFRTFEAEKAAAHKAPSSSRMKWMMGYILKEGASVSSQLNAERCLARSHNHNH